MKEPSRAPLPQSKLPSVSPASRSRGLLDELIEEGVLRKDLVMPDHTFSVTTRIHCDDGACFFRTAVSCDGTEINQPPWAPSFRNLAGELSLGNAVAARSELARRALETHLAIYTRAGQVLERQGHLLSAADRQQRALMVGVPALLVLGALALWWFLGPGAGTDSTAPAGPGASRAVAPEASSSVEVQPEAPTDEQLAASGSLPGTAPLSGPWAQAAPRSAPPAQPVPDAPKPPSKPAPASPRRAPVEARAEKPSDAEHVEPPPSPAQSLSRQPQAPPAPTATPSKLVAGVLSPSAHSVLQLAPGSRIYAADSVELSHLPPGYGGLRCVTTQQAGGDTKQGITLSLTAPSRVLVLFDQEVKRRPAWLDSFQQTGDMVTAVDPGENGETFTYLVFRKDFPAGTVSLGSNTAASSFARAAKKLVHRRALMYLVCLTRPN